MPVTVMSISHDCYTSSVPQHTTNLYSQCVNLFSKHYVDVVLCGKGEASQPAWSDNISVRLHVLAALKGQLESYLAIGDAFFYGKAGLPR